MIDLARLFSSRKNALAGLDIGRDAVRMVELSRGKKGQLVLQRYASEKLIGGAISSDGIEDLEHVITATQRLWSKCAYAAGKVAIGIPATAVTVQQLSIGLLSSASNRPPHRKQLETLVMEGIAPLLDYRIADACTDFCITTPGQDHVLVAATRKDVVEDRIAVAESLNLQAVVADADSYAAHAALARACAAPDDLARSSTDAFALLHLDLCGAQLSLLTAAQIVHVVEYGERGGGMQVALFDTEQTSRAAAHELNALQSRHPERQISRLIVSGSEATAPGLIAALQRHTGMTITVADPFAGMTLATGVDATLLADRAPAYLVACGLALRRFD